MSEDNIKDFDNLDESESCQDCPMSEGEIPEGLQHLFSGMMGGSDGNVMEEMVTEALDAGFRQSMGEPSDNPMDMLGQDSDALKIMFKEVLDFIVSSLAEAQYDEDLREKRFEALKAEAEVDLEILERYMSVLHDEALALQALSILKRRNEIKN